MATAAEQPGWTHREALVNNVRLHWVEAGAGRPVLLLHGFPQCWWMWRHQMQPLADAGFRVIAPDLRGYNLSDKPSGVSAYRMENLVADVEGLIRQTDLKRAHVVGHDWGGLIGWWLAMLAPDRVERLGILNAPHPAAFRREIRMPDQMLRSWYAAAVQLPVLPELAIRRDDFALLESAFRASTVRPGAITDDDVRRYKQAAARPGALTAMLNYYRAAARRPGHATHRPPRAAHLGRAGPGAHHPDDARAGGVGAKPAHRTVAGGQPLGGRRGAGAGDGAADGLPHPAVSA